MVKNGVLQSTVNYVIESRKHPPFDLIAGLYIKRLAREGGAVGEGIPIRRILSFQGPVVYEEVPAIC